MFTVKYVQTDGREQIFEADHIEAVPDPADDSRYTLACAGPQLKFLSCFGRAFIANELGKPIASYQLPERKPEDDDPAKSL